VKPTPAQENKFLAIVESHKKLLFKISNAYCSDPEDRKDLLQEIILQLWKSFPKYDDTYALSTWMYRIALHVSISFHRKQKSRRNLKLSKPDPILAIREEEGKQELNENLQLLYAFISELKHLDKALMILYLEGKNHQEIGEILGLSKSNVGTKIGRIKEKLKLHFAKKTSTNIPTSNQTKKH